MSRVSPYGRRPLIPVRRAVRRTVDAVMELVRTLLAKEFALPLVATIAEGWTGSLLDCRPALGQLPFQQVAAGIDPDGLRVHDSFVTRARRMATIENRQSFGSTDDAFGYWLCRGQPDPWIRNDSV